MTRKRFVYKISWGTLSESSYEDEVGSTYFLAYTMHEALAEFKELFPELFDDITSIEKALESEILFVKDK